MRDKFTLHSAHSKNLLLRGYLKVIKLNLILLVAVDLIRLFGVLMHKDLNLQ